MLCNTGCCRDDLCQTLWSCMPHVEALPKDQLHHRLFIQQISNTGVIRPQSWPAEHQSAFPFQVCQCPHTKLWFAHRENHKSSFIAPCVCNFVQVWLWLTVHLIKIFIEEHVEGLCSVVAFTWIALAFEITLAATKIPQASSASRRQGNQPWGQENTQFLRAALHRLGLLCNSSAFLSKHTVLSLQQMLVSFYSVEMCLKRTDFWEWMNNRAGQK